MSHVIASSQMKIDGKTFHLHIDRSAGVIRGVIYYVGEDGKMRTRFKEEGRYAEENVLYCWNSMRNQAGGTNE